MPSEKCHLIVAGAQKSGTTWLHNTLEYQKEFWCPSSRQEIHFFDKLYNCGYEWYEELYNNKKRKVTFDVTPDYMYHSIVTKRIKKYEKYMEIM